MNDITVRDAWYWPTDPRKVTWMANGKMFNGSVTTPWVKHMIAQGIVREPDAGDQVLMDMAGF